MKYVWLVLNWILGGVFLLLGSLMSLGGILKAVEKGADVRISPSFLMSLAVYLLPAAPLIGISMLLLPPVRESVYAKVTHRKLPFKARAISIIMLLCALVYLVDSNPDRELARQGACEKQQITDDFNAHGSQIVSDARAALVAGEYRKAISMSSKYSVVGNADLTVVRNDAIAKLDELRRTEETEKLLLELKSIPDSNYEKQKALYQQLAALYPAETLFEEQASYCELKSSEAETTKKLLLPQVVASVASAKTQSNYTETAANLNLKMIWIKPGSFQMGSDSGKDDEKPVHAVTLSGFWLGKYEVTQAQYEEVMGVNPAKFKGVDNPVEQVSWKDAVAFCDKLSRTTGRKYMLPTEAQWEYACRAGSIGAFCFGDADSKLSRYAWYGSDSETHPVGKKAPNAWGLYDMHGNVWEWCQDSYNGTYTGAPTDGSVWINPSASLRVFRGGGWLPGARNCRSAPRTGGIPSFRSNRLGFRLASVR